MNTTPLTIDQRSASIDLTPAEIREWATGRRIFVSSLITDMPSEREAARQAVTSIGATPVMFEDLGGQDISAEQAYLSGVRSSDVYLGLWGPRYGVQMSDGYSATHTEFREAERNGLRLCIFVNTANSGSMDGQQRDLVAGTRNMYTTSSWSTPDHLREQIVRRLSDLAAEEMAPWVRIGTLLIRAREISSNGDNVIVHADTRSQQVHAELVRLRERSSDVVFTTPSDSKTARLVDLQSTSRVFGVHSEVIALRVSDNRGSGMRMNVNGVSADELSERALADALFGTRTMPRDASWMQEKADPLAPLRGLQLHDVALRPISRLLVCEHLFVSGAAATVDFFALSPARAGERFLKLSWTPVQQYQNEPRPAQRHIEGTVSGL
jgi:hypothetical protein